MKMYLLLLAANLVACGGGDSPSYGDRYYFEVITSSTSQALYGPYPSLELCAVARGKHDPKRTTGCHT